MSNDPLQQLQDLALRLDAEGDNVLRNELMSIGRQLANKVAALEAELKEYEPLADKLDNLRVAAQAVLKDLGHVRQWGRDQEREALERLCRELEKQ